jgi:hypothetical protein
MKAHDFYEERQNFYLKPTQLVRGGIAFCLVVGIASFAIGMGTGQQMRTWGSVLFNLFFFFSLAVGGMAFGGMQDLIGATWGRPIKRLHESFGSFLPISFMVFVAIFFCIGRDIGGAKGIYSWIADPKIIEHFWGKNVWLQPVPMMVRDVSALLLIVLISRWQFRQTLERDVALVAGNRDEAKRLGALSVARLRYWSAPVLIAYSLLFSLISFDILMALSPLWYSTLWGGWTFAIMMQSLMAALLIAMFALKKTALGQYIARSQFHDVGKMMHGFTIFFAYTTYAHILTYWYGNVPEETEYFIHRLHGPWFVILCIVPILAFVLPLFALIPKVSKWTSGVTIPLAALILVAQWLTYLLVVMPEVVEGATWKFPTIELGLFFGFLGLFLGSIVSFGRRFPMLSIADPLLEDSLAGGHH